MEVAKTISSGLVDETKINPYIIFAGLVGAILWNLLTWLLGLPSSSSHALFGGLIGAVVVAAGAGAVHFGTLISKIILPAFISPVLAGVIALVGTVIAYRSTARSDDTSVKKGFKAGQIASASVAAFAASQGVIGTTLVALVALVALGVAVGIDAASRRTPVTADNVNDVPSPVAPDEVRTESGVTQA